jgi:hypothetical protein
LKDRNRFIVLIRNGRRFLLEILTVSQKTIHRSHNLGLSEVLFLRERTLPLRTALIPESSETIRARTVSPTLYLSDENRLYL